MSIHDGVATQWDTLDASPVVGTNGKTDGDATEDIDEKADINPPFAHSRTTNRECPATIYGGELENQVVHIGQQTATQLLITDFS